jgi:hypothetical protein
MTMGRPSTKAREAWVVRATPVAPGGSVHVGAVEPVGLDDLMDRELVTTLAQSFSHRPR